MSNKSLVYLKKYLAKSQHRIKNVHRKGVIAKFAAKVGLVYFGTVDQHSDEHRPIRGFTVSASHSDKHLCVGTLGGFDISIVDRSDFKQLPNKSIASKNWLIFAIELKNNLSPPHFLICANGDDARVFSEFFSSFPNIKPIDLGEYGFSDEFIKRFSVYAKPDNASLVYEMVKDDVSKVLAAHFWPLSIEVNNNFLYIYSTHKKITSDLLGSMLENGLWLAGKFDKLTEPDN